MRTVMFLLFAAAALGQSPQFFVKCDPQDMKNTNKLIGNGPQLGMWILRVRNDGGHGQVGQNRLLSYCPNLAIVPPDIANSFLLLKQNNNPNKNAVDVLSLAKNQSVTMAAGVTASLLISPYFAIPTAIANLLQNHFQGNVADLSVVIQRMRIPDQIALEAGADTYFVVFAPKISYKEVKPSEWIPVPLPAPATVPPAVAVPTPTSTAPAQPLKMTMAMDSALPVQSMRLIAYTPPGDAHEATEFVLPGLGQLPKTAPMNVSWERPANTWHLMVD